MAYLYAPKKISNTFYIVFFSSLSITSPPCQTAHCFSCLPNSIQYTRSLRVFVAAVLTAQPTCLLGSLISSMDVFSRRIHTEEVLWYINGKETKLKFHTPLRTRRRNNIPSYNNFATFTINQCTRQCKISYVWCGETRILCATLKRDSTHLIFQAL